MNISKFTQKSIQAVNDLEKLAYEYGNQEIEQEHLLMSLLRQEDSLILKLIAKMGIDQNLFMNGVEQALNKRVKVSGGQPYVGQYLNKVLVNAEDVAKHMGDEYVSVEHLFLSMLNECDPSLPAVFLPQPASAHPVVSVVSFYHFDAPPLLSLHGVLL